MTGGTIAWGITFAVLCVATGITIGYQIGHARGLRHAAEDAENARDAAVVASWKDLPDEDTRPAPPWPPAPPQASRDGPGKHRHPAGPRHAGLPVAGRLPAEPSPWAVTMTLPAPVGSPPWEQAPDRMLQVQGTLRAGEDAPEPPTEVLEPTPADCLRPDTMTDTGWTRQMARQLAQEMDADIERMVQDTDRWIAEHVTATDPVLKAITK